MATSKRIVMISMASAMLGFFAAFSFFYMMPHKRLRVASSEDMQYVERSPRTNMGISQIEMDQSHTIQRNDLNAFGNSAVNGVKAFGNSVVNSLRAFGNSAVSHVASEQSYIISRNDTRKFGNVAVNDFQTFPCLFGAVPDIASSYDRTCVRTVNQNVEDTPHSKCVSLNYPPLKVTAPICIYDTAIDKFISKDIQSTKTYEADLVTKLMKFLLADPEMEFLDLGCNIGAYTVVAAKLGKNVVCVDPIVANVKMVSTSLKLGNTRSNVKVIWNAMSDTRRLISLKRYANNVGGTAIQDEVGENAELAETITLDDLLPLYKGKKVLMKMDLETHEAYAVRGGPEFFRQVDIRLIQTEFTSHRKRPFGQALLDVMEERGFKPYSDVHGKSPLDRSAVNNWPTNLYYMKN